MVRFSAREELQLFILEAVEGVNERQKTRLLAKMQTHLGPLKGKRIAIWGLAFKPRTDECARLPPVPLIHGILSAGATVQAYDPEAMTVARGIFGSKITYAENSYTR